MIGFADMTARWALKVPIGQCLVLFWALHLTSNSDEAGLPSAWTNYSVLLRAAAVTRDVTTFRADLRASSCLPRKPDSRVGLIRTLCCERPSLDLRRPVPKSLDDLP